MCWAASALGLHVSAKGSGGRLIADAAYCVYVLLPSRSPAFYYTKKVFAPEIFGKRRANKNVKTTVSTVAEVGLP